MKWLPRVLLPKLRLQPLRRQHQWKTFAHAGFGHLPPNFNLSSTGGSFSVVPVLNGQNYLATASIFQAFLYVLDPIASHESIGNRATPSPFVPNSVWSAYGVS